MINSVNQSRGKLEQISVYPIERNGDSRTDLVVKDGYNNKFVFIQEEDGSYKLLSEVLREEQERVKNTIEEKVNVLSSEMK